MYRLMGGIFTTGWVPVDITVTVAPRENSAEVEVLGGDEKGIYLFEVSRRRGETPYGQRFFLAQFRHACGELSGGAWEPT